MTHEFTKNAHPWKKNPKPSILLRIKLKPLTFPGILYYFALFLSPISNFSILPHSSWAIHTEIHSLIDWLIDSLIDDFPSNPLNSFSPLGPCTSAYNVFPSKPHTADSQLTLRSECWGHCLKKASTGMTFCCPFLSFL